MNRIRYTRILAVFLAFLIVMLPVCFADALNLVYDKNGNLVSGDGFYREYNSLNQLAVVRNGSTASDPILQVYTYHPTEERVLIKNVTNNEGTWRETVYYVSKDFVRIVNSSGTFDTTYVYHEGQLVAERDDAGTETFYHPDHLGSTSLITDSSGNLVENTFYTPYGQILSGGEESRYDYEAKEFDSVTNTYDFHFRGYKAEWGKFTQPDTLLPNLYDPQQLNRYSFERNNPWRHTDETGHTPFHMLVVLGLIITLYMFTGELPGLMDAAGIIFDTSKEIYSDIKTEEQQSQQKKILDRLVVEPAYTVSENANPSSEEQTTETISGSGNRPPVIIGIVNEGEEDDETSTLLSDEKLKEELGLLGFINTEEKKEVGKEKSYPYYGGGSGGGNGGGDNCQEHCTCIYDQYGNCELSCTTTC